MTQNCLKIKITYYTLCYNIDYLQEIQTNIYNKLNLSPFILAFSMIDLLIWMHNLLSIIRYALKAYLLILNELCILINSFTCKIYISIIF